MKCFYALFCAAFISCVFFVCNSCSSASSSGIFFEKLENIDTFIKTENYGAAWRLLKKTAKHAHSAADYLSIIRRALILDKNEFAEKYMRKAVSRFSGSKEITAVYVHFLMSAKRYNEALQYAPELEGGAYGSLYTELRFLSEDKADFLSPAYKQAYLDAALTTGNGAYVRNAALIEAFAGNMEAAFALRPAVMSAYDYPEFWARIGYDSGNFIQCVEDLRYANPAAQVQMLIADALLRSGDERGAVSAWLDSIEHYAAENPAAWYNAARASLKSGNIGYGYFFLSTLTRQFPDYTPGLAAYARYSLAEPPKTEEHIFSAVLRERGLKTLAMELDELVPAVAPEKVMHAMEKSLERSRDPALALEYIKLQWKIKDIKKTIDPLAGDKSRAADIWKLLEKEAFFTAEENSALSEQNNSSAAYADSLIHFALRYFCRYNMIGEALELWERRRHSRYGQHSDENGGEDISFLHKDWEYDLLSYIAFKQKRYAFAERILSAGINNKNINLPAGAVLNLAALYNGSGRRIQAAALYRQVLDMPDIRDNKKLQADIYYKLGLIQREQGEMRAAVLSLNQSVSLDPDHAKARLLLKQIDSVSH